MQNTSSGGLLAHYTALSSGTGCLWRRVFELVQLTEINCGIATVVPQVTPRQSRLGRDELFRVI